MKSLLSIFMLSFLLFADEGFIPLGKIDISIYEPGQRAVILWNGKKEVLIISTDIKASENTKVLTILPLPAEPKISKGDFKIFEEIERFIRMRSPYRGKKKNGDEERVKILYFKKLGAHNITVTHADHPNELIEWIRQFVKKQGIEDFKYSADFESIKKGYFLREKKYFGFDVIEVGDKEKTREPIIYEFESSSLYYPLEISSLNKGVSEITLYCFTPWLFDFVTLSLPLDFAYYISRDRKRRTPIILTYIPKHILLNKGISQEFLDSFPERFYLTVLKYKGKLNFFSDFCWNLFLKPVEIKK